MLETDSLANIQTYHAPGSNFTTTSDGVTRNTLGMTPLRVVNSLKTSATEEQKDSAIQANFKPGQITYNQRPDTLSCFGFKPSKHDVFSNPKFMDKEYFPANKYFHPEKGLPQNGIMGDPIPYLMRNDNTITALLLGCFIVAILAFSFTKGFLFRQVKHFFYTPRSVAEMTETSLEMRLQIFLVAQTALLLGMLYYVYSVWDEGDRFLSDNILTTIGIFTGITAAYFVVKDVLYKIVNWVFFTRKQNERWNKTWLFLTASEGVLLFPFVLLIVYFNLPLATGLLCVGGVLILTKILAFYKCFVIFFTKTSISMQIILYFCTLELMPALTLWGVLELIGNYLKVNY